MTEYKQEQMLCQYQWTILTALKEVIWYNIGIWFMLYFFKEFEPRKIIQTCRCLSL